MGNAERKDEAVERNLSPRVDGAEQFGGRLLAPAFARGDGLRTRSVSFLEQKDVGRFLQQAIFKKLGGRFFAEALDIEGVARGEVIEPLHGLRRTGERVDAAPRRFWLAGFRVDLAY